jgi:mono/diheme cytochrome c family protein
LAAALLIGMHHAAAAAGGAAEGHRLAEAWCKVCHAIEPQGAGVSDQAPAFAAIANRRGTTELSLKVFLKTSHQNMPDLVIAPDQADALADYILSLKTR